jgi:hypothetical protein
MSKIFQLDFGPGFVFHLTIPKVFPRPLTDIYKCLGGFLHLKPTAGCQISTSILGVGYINISCKISNGKVRVHFGFNANVLPGSLTGSIFKVLH